jgi:hypothetical protein
MTSNASSRRAPGHFVMVATLALALSIATASAAGQLTVSSELQGAVYPQQPAARPAGDGDMRGAAGLEFDRTLPKGAAFRSDLFVYGSSRRTALVDGEAAVSWRGSAVEVAGGLLREQWGRFTNSPLDVLGPSNTPFSLVEPQRRLSQPTLRTTAFLDGVSIDVYALAGGRRQSLPESDGRFGFGVSTRDVVHRGSMGDAAVAVRVSSTSLDVDWSAHLFRGASPRPTFVPRFMAGGQLAAVDATYTDITQAGGELETTRADWRFMAEGFIRSGGLDITGRERRYGYVAGAAEYQRFGAFDGAWNLIPRFELTADTRGDRVDIPFASSLSAGIRVERAQLLPVRVDAAWLYDWAIRGHGVMTSMEKPLAESPNLNVGFRVTAFSSGAQPSVLDVWEDDLEIYTYLRVELSR